MKLQNPSSTPSTSNNNSSSSANSSPANPSPNSSLTLMLNNGCSSTNTNSTAGKISKNNAHSLHHHQQLGLGLYDPSNFPNSSAQNSSTIAIIDAGSSSSADDQEFLPVCDALFNVISLAIYFCDIVFDILAAYSLYVNDGLGQWTTLCLTFILTSVLLSQALSYHLYTTTGSSISKKQQAGHQFPWLLITHLFGCGVLWRYFKLFIPLDMKLVKVKVRDLILLRLVHGFCESGPMLCIQLYLILSQSSWSDVSDLNLVSTTLSLLSLCWALASFSKNIRLVNVHKLMLTWLGLIFQFGWRLGTITTRVLALTLYATIYHHWILLVLVMHWLSMFIWIISPHFKIFNGEKIGPGQKYGYSALIAVVYVFCYINILDESNSRMKMTIFYGTMCLENVLLVSVWFIAVRVEEARPWYVQIRLLGLLLGSFTVGLVFMWLYYRFFHVKKLSYSLGIESGASSMIRESKSSSLLNGNFESPNSGLVVSTKIKGESGLNNNNYKTTGLANSGNNGHGIYGINSASAGFYGGPNLNLNKRAGGPDNDNNGVGLGKKSKYNNNGGPVHHGMAGQGIQGVFNCRFNPAMKRKKKKPSSFVPPANLSQQTQGQGQNSVDPVQVRQRTPKMAQTPNGLPLEFGSNSKMSTPFWKRSSHSSEANPDEHIDSVSVCTPAPAPRVNIQQKLYEKKQQQLADLREIEQEIRATSDGLGFSAQFAHRDHNHKHYGAPNYSTILPPPYEKKRPWFSSPEAPVHSSPRPPLLPPNRSQGQNRSRGGMEELVLDPGQYLAQPRSSPYRVQGAHSHVHNVHPGHHDQGQDNFYMANDEDEDGDGQTSDWSYNYDAYAMDDDDLYAGPVHNHGQPQTNESRSRSKIEAQAKLSKLQHTGGSGPRKLRKQSAGCPSQSVTELGPSGKSQFARDPARQIGGYKSCRRIPSDLESQLSLTRSYTLPREFKYRRKLMRMMIKNEQAAPSANSSDGDVDSGEDETEIYSHLQKIPLPVPSVHHLHIPNGEKPSQRRLPGHHSVHETKL